MVGGGTVAERKVRSLLECGGSVVVISPRLTKGLCALKERGLIEHIKRGYREGDLKGAFLVIGATNSTPLNRRVAKEAESLGVLLNVVDTPELCNFIVPSVVRRGGLTIAISTSGISPYSARWIRQKIESLLPEEFAKVLEIVGAVRKMVLKGGLNNDKRLRIFERLLDSPLTDYIRSGNRRAINALLKEVTGSKDITLSKLGIKL